MTSDGAAQISLTFPPAGYPFQPARRIARPDCRLRKDSSRRWRLTLHCAERTGFAENRTHRRYVRFSIASPSGLSDPLAFAGASPGSSSLLYSSLIRQLTRSTSTNSSTAQRPCLVSRLASRDCSNIKNALRSLIGGFIGSDVEIEADDEGEEEDQHVRTAFSLPARSLTVLARQVGGPATLKSALFVPEDMLNLKAWYEHRFGKKGARGRPPHPTGRTDLPPADSDNAPTVVVLLENLEAMDGKVLTQMIDSLSFVSVCNLRKTGQLMLVVGRRHYVDTLPLVFLVGIATTVDAAYSLLSRKTANKLDASSFFVDPGVSAFNALVRGVSVLVSVLLHHVAETRLCL